MVEGPDAQWPQMDPMDALVIQKKEDMVSSVCWDMAAQAHQGFEEEHSDIRQAVPLSMKSMRRDSFHGGAPCSTLSSA